MNISIDAKEQQQKSGNIKYPFIDPKLRNGSLNNQLSKVSPGQVFIQSSERPLVVDSAGFLVPWLTGRNEV